MSHVQRTPYMQKLMSEAIPQVSFYAIKQGKIEGAWEKAIANKIHKDYLDDHPEACEIVESVSSPGMAASKAYLLAAYLITSSKINLSHANP